MDNELQDDEPQLLELTQEEIAELKVLVADLQKTRSSRNRMITYLEHSEKIRQERERARAEAEEQGEDDS